MKLQDAIKITEVNMKMDNTPSEEQIYDGFWLVNALAIVPINSKEWISYYPDDIFYFKDSRRELLSESKKRYLIRSKNWEPLPF